MSEQIKNDIALIYKAVEFIYNKRVNYIFDDKTRINNTKIAAYNHSTVFLIDPLNKDVTEYSFKVPDKLMIGWQANIKAELYDALPKEIQYQSRFDHPIISGSLCTEFIKHQKFIEGWYTTVESFLATILHEYAHIYYNSFKSYFYHNKQENISYLDRALKILKGESKESLNMWVPEYRDLTEVFACCAETDASKIFWPDHYKTIMDMDTVKIKKAIEKEKTLNLDTQDSVLYNSHLFSTVMGTFLLNDYPKTWPQEMLK